MKTIISFIWMALALVISVVEMMNGDPMPTAFWAFLIIANVWMAGS